MSSKLLILSKLKPFSTGLDASGPKGWSDVVRAASEEMYGSGPSTQIRSIFSYFFNKDAVAISWTPNLRTLFLSLLVPQRVLYICWGLPASHAKSNKKIGSKIKFCFFRIMLKRIGLVAVNESITRTELEHLGVTRITQVPYLVDTGFFSYDGSKKSCLVVVPGNNGRDEKLVHCLIQEGFDISRITSSPVVAKEYEETSAANFELALNLPWNEWRSSLLKAKVVCLPMSDIHHAAGQTSLLEAVSCGCRIVISNMRTSEIIPSEIVLKASSNDEFVALIRLALESEDLDLVKNAACSIHGRHGFEAVKVRLVFLLRSLR